MPRLPVLSFLILSAGVVADPPATLRVLRALPAGDAGPLATVSVSFDRPIAASLEGVSADPSRILKLEPAVAGRAEWRDPVTLLFTPARPLAPGTSYKVTVDTTFTSADGARLAAPYRFEFRVRGPKLLAGLPVGPNRSPSLITPLDTFTLVLGQSISPAALTRWTWIETDRSCSAGRQVIRLRIADQGPIPQNASWELREAGGWERDRRADSLRRVVALVPADPIPLDCAAALIAPPWFDELGAELPGRFTFRTYGPFKIEDANCTGTCQVGPVGPAYLRFSTPVKGAEIQRHVTLRPAVPVV
ncbi:MAG TPA: Ig-like domain-containing protein, partial [Gemmatimonadales bacterium]|nr:Ig-like domain-containing protein [Gemmatimonadales bacterium]